LAKLKGILGTAVTVCIVGGFALYMGIDLYKRVSFRENRPEIMQQIYWPASDSEHLHVRMAVKQDPFWKYPKRETYLGDKEILYRKQEDGTWKEYKCIWTDKGWYLQLEAEETRNITEADVPGQPKGALEVIIDIDSGEEYAEARFDAKSGYESTKKKIDEWTSNIEPLFKSHYKK